MKTLPTCFFICIAVLTSITFAHDTWVQTNTNVIRSGDVIHIDFFLGNHGNDHRDFKMAGKPSLDNCTLDLISPTGRRYDLKSGLIDEGYAPKEGFWTTSFEPTEPGLYMVSQTSDQVLTMLHERNVRSAKTFFLVSKSLDHVPADNPGFDRVIGSPLEIVPQTNPVTPMGPGEKIAVRLLYHGKPLPNTRISFIPRGQTLAENFDPKYERKTDAIGMASFEPTDANYYLIVAHLLNPAAKGDGYTATKYSATLTVYVPAICPCCGE